MTLDDYLHCIENGIPFVSIKVNHGYWERLVAAEDLQRSGVTNPTTLDRTLGQPFLFVTDYVTDMREALTALSNAPGRVHLSATPYAWPACRRIEGTPATGLARTLDIIKDHVPAHLVNDDGLLWKRAVYDGSIARLIEKLRGRSVILIGPPWLTHFGTFAAIDDFQHIPIDPVGARGERHDFLARLQRDHRAEGHPVYLLQAGSYSPWLGNRIRESLDNATVLDLGLVLTICYLPVLAGLNWARLEHQKVAAAIEAINPDWPGDARFHGPATPPERRRHCWHGFRDGVLTRVAEIAEVSERSMLTHSYDAPDLDHAGPISFVENKRTDFRRVEQLLHASRSRNHWTNFGPLTLALERLLSELLGLPEDRAVVMCASGTAALFALAGLHAHKSGRRLRWVTSACTFPCHRVGPFHDAIVVDCDQSGLLDLAQLDMLDGGAWDGLVVTNLFGTQKQLERFTAYAAARGKRILIDGATALFGVDRSKPGGPDEMVSLHHTKPWGFGEGGCAIVDRADVPLLRSVINFGLGQPAAAAGSYAFNGKMSEIAAAAIIERLERLPSWRFFYQKQRHRIGRLAADADILPLGGINGNSIANHIPLMLPRPLRLDDVTGQRFVVQKYYRPLRPGFPQAEDIFSRIINVPCHPGMAALATGELETFFEKLASAKSD